MRVVYWLMVLWLAELLVAALAVTAVSAAVFVRRVRASGEDSHRSLPVEDFWSKVRRLRDDESFEVVAGSWEHVDGSPGVPLDTGGMYL